MLTRFLVLSLLTQWNLISSEPELNEKTKNTRETRQLNFGDCCPCPVQDALQDQSSANSLIDAISATEDTSCPCRMTSDSESASSIFRPAFRAAQPNIRPVLKKEEPKPLLNPEVDLASSVLETIREVTDQEYQEALVRDAARSALQFMDPELKTEPRNVVNIIVSPNDDNNGDIMTSEATEMQGSTCVLPPLSTNNNLEQQPSTNLLKHILAPPKFPSNGILNRNLFDIEGSSSNTQERMATPLKNNILENLKSRLNLLNLKPFSNTDNRDFLTSPNILQKYYLKNNITNRILSQNRPITDVNSESTNNVNEPFAKNIAKNAGIKKNHMETDKEPDFKKDATATFDNSARKLKMSAGDIFPNNVCTETGSEPNLSVKENSESFDVIPSSSKVIEVKNLDITESPNVIIQENEADKVLDIDADINNFIPSTLESVTKQSSFPKNGEEVSQEITEDVVDVQTNNSKTENTTGHSEKIKDMESEPSIIKNIVTNLPVTVTSPEFIFSSEDESKLRNAYPITSKDVRDYESLSSTSAERDVDESKFHNLANIKSDIFRSPEGFKKANNKIQEKLRYNVQDALQLVIDDEPLHSPSETMTLKPLSEIRDSSVEQPQKNANTVTNTSDGESMSTQDLQNMSDSLLELSSLKDNDETLTTSVINEDFVEELENKPTEFKKMSYIDDMITTPTSLNDKNNIIINLKNEKSNLKVRDYNLNSKSNKIEGNIICSNNINTIPKNSDSSITKNEENEMTAQPSNSVLNSIYKQDLGPPRLGLLQRDLTVQPEDNPRPIGGIKDFLNSITALSVDRSTNDDSESVFFDTQPLLRSNFGKNIDSSKSFSRSNTPKFSSDSNLSSNIAKVSSPKSLHFNSLLPTLPHSDDEADLLGFASQKIPHNTNLKNTVRNNFGNGLNPVLKTIESPRMLQDTFSTPRLAQSLKSHTNNALQTFRDTLDMTRGEPFTINKNNLLGKSLINPDHLFENVRKTHEDFNDKIQAFHSDLNRRLSSISSRTSSDGSRLLWTPSKLKNRAESHDIASKNTAATLVKTKSPAMKNTLASKNIPSIETNKKKSTDFATRSNRVNILRSNIREKLGILPHQKDLGSEKAPIAINPPKSILTRKQPLKSNVKLKPLKENKVTISFATTSIRPDTLKSRLKPTLEMDALRSRSIGDLAKFPKLSKSLEDNKKPTLQSKLKTNEPKVSASEISMSRAVTPETISQELSSLEESGRLYDRNINYEDRPPVDISEANRRKIMLPSKFRRPFATGITSDGTIKNDKVLSSRQKENLLDATQSASNNIDTSISATTFVEERLKNNNQSFKCKMVCIQDILDSTDTYKA